MLKKLILLSIVITAGYACKKHCKNIDTPDTDILPPALLKEVIVTNLPSPYFYFEYDVNKKPVMVSYAGGLKAYSIFYTGTNISEMRNRNTVYSYKLNYEYDNKERVSIINYLYPNGDIYKKCKLTYDGKKLVKLEKQINIGGNFVVENTLSFAYYSDGNLSLLIDYRHPVNGQMENTYIDTFTEYDNKRNVDGFMLLHNHFFEEIFQLPGIQLQINNPHKLTRTGTGINYEIIYSYQYNNKNLPLTKKGEMVITKGTDIGQRTTLNSNFSYYE